MVVTCVATPQSARAAFAIYYGAWPERSLRTKGWSWKEGDARLVYTRPGTPAEAEYARASMRFQGWFYKDWSSVAADEVKFGVNANYLRDHYYKPKED